MQKSDLAFMLVRYSDLDIKAVEDLAGWIGGRRTSEPHIGVVVFLCCRHTERFRAKSKIVLKVGRVDHNVVS